MDYLQYYIDVVFTIGDLLSGFKPCYKWITFNTLKSKPLNIAKFVLNLVINGLPSILKCGIICLEDIILSFKPCYKWITFNTFPLNNYHS